VNTGFLYGINEIIIYVVFLVLMLVTTDVGFRFGRRSETRTPDKTKSQISAVEDAILGILALLLGFTMFMAVSRFDARKQLVLDEANAIGTSLRRTELLPAADGSGIASLLRQYIGARVQYGTSGNDLARLDSLRMQSARLQNEFWARAIAYGQKNPDPVRIGLLLQSLNQVIDLESARKMAFENPVPESVIYVNCIVALLAIMLVGYKFGLHGRRQIFSTFVLTLAVTLVLALIIDLDRPRSGFIRVSQQPMIDLQQGP
jgi:prepilin signal peptidase PulO-like enzyme (type II secretory pathway)